MDWAPWLFSPLGVLLAAVALEFTLGEPPAKLHPVVWIGNVVKTLLRFEPGGPKARLAFGVVVTALTCGAVVVAGSFANAALVTGVLADTPWPLLALNALMLKSAFSVRGLWRAGKGMRTALEDSLDAGRLELRHLCSRDPSQLERSELIAATVESLAENTCDSFVAPLFYFALLGPVGALAYRAINTLDSMIGYRGRYEHTGKFAARLDDVVNFVPARIAALLWLVAAWVLRMHPARGFRIARRDRNATLSPNAGWTMAAAAGCLGVRLEKRGEYVLGDALMPLTSHTIANAQRLMLGSFLLMVGLVIGYLSLAQHYGY